MANPELLQFENGSMHVPPNYARADARETSQEQKVLLTAGIVAELSIQEQRRDRFPSRQCSDGIEKRPGPGRSWACHYNLSILQLRPVSLDLIFQPLA